MAKKETKNQKTEKELAYEQEKLRIIAQADAVKGEQLIISPEGEINKENELKQFALGDIEDPEKKYDLYYKGIQKLLKKHLPEGKKNYVARNYIYEEKNVYLTRDKRINKAGIRGADGRMGYVADADEILNLIINWVVKKGLMVDLFTTLRDLNASKGYGTRNF